MTTTADMLEILVSVVLTLVIAFGTSRFVVAVWDYLNRHKHCTCHCDHHCDSCEESTHD